MLLFFEALTDRLLNELHVKQLQIKETVECLGLEFSVRLEVGSLASDFETLGRFKAESVSIISGEKTCSASFYPELIDAYTKSECGLDVDTYLKELGFYEVDLNTSGNGAMEAIFKIKPETNEPDAKAGE